MKKFLLAVLLLTGMLVSGAEKPVPQGSADRAGGLYELHAPITFRFTGLEPDTVYPVKLRGDDTVCRDLQAKSDGQGTLTVTAELARPGFVRCAVTYAPGKEVLAGAGSHLEKISAARPLPADFDEFWRKQLAALQASPLRPELKPVAGREGFAVYDLSLPCPGSAAPVRGYFTVKTGAAPKSCPAILSLHGAGVKSASPAYVFAGYGFITLDVNAHGIDNGREPAYYADLNRNALKKYQLRGLEDRRENYFRGMFLRAYRALQFLKSRPEWDGRTLVVYGSSQGGFQALAAAALEPQVTAAVAFVPAGCDHGGAAAGREEGWPHYCRSAVYRQNPAVAAAELDYFDAVNFARRITRADLFMSAGLIDDTCPAASVCAAYNACPTTGRKQLVIGPRAGHQVFRESAAASAAFLRRFRTVR